MRNRPHIFFATMTFLFTACSNDNIYTQRSGTLDSLSGAVSTLVTEIKKADTAMLQRATTRFAYYKQFIHQHVHDTVNRYEADNLQHFYEGGRKLEDFVKNRATLMARAALISSQLARLKTDIVNGAIDEGSSAGTWPKKKAGNDIAGGGV